MERSLFYKKHRISDTRPKNINVSSIEVRDFAETLRDFMHENFEGAVRVNIKLNATGNIEIVEDYAIYYFKLLVCSIFGRDVINIDVSTDYTEFTVKAKCSSGIFPEREDLYDIIRTARNAGFEITPERDAITIKTKLRPRITIGIGSITINRLKRSMANIFFG